MDKKNCAQEVPRQWKKSNEEIYRKFESIDF